MSVPLEAVMIDDRKPAASVAARSGRVHDRTSWAVLAGVFLLALLGTVYFASESFDDRDPTLDLIAVVILGAFTFTLLWLIAGAWRTRGSGSG